MSETGRLVIAICKHCSKAIKLLDGECESDGHWSHMSVDASANCGEWADPKKPYISTRYDGSHRGE